tara:strand:+ start:769 stop:2022 length:1254 start_codon:yes stop_codon:yes gene_type:complete
MEIEVIGIGAVGIVTAVGLAELGHKVSAVDIDSEKLDKISRGIAPINEPQLANLLEKHISQNNISVNSHITEIPIKIVCVATPSNEDGSTNTAYVRNVISELDELLVNSSERFQLIIRSTISANLIDTLLSNVSEDFKTTVDVYLNPEFLREGTAVDDFFKPPFIIVGSDLKDYSVIEEIYKGIDADIYSVDPVSATMIKYACNAFHALKITFANEIGSISESLGGNPIEIMSIFTKDMQLNISEKYLRPGFAYGGSCLNKDLKALKTFSREMNKSTELINSINSSNETRIKNSVENILSMTGENILIFGLSFKTGTNDLRDSPYLAVAKELQKNGKQITVIDPDLKYDDIKNNKENFRIIDLADLSFEHCDAIIYFKDLLDISKIDEILTKNMIIFDPELLLYSKGIINDRIKLLI